jgi:hypothetical protein
MLEPLSVGMLLQVLSIGEPVEVALLNAKPVSQICRRVPSHESC